MIQSLASYSIHRCRICGVLHVRSILYVHPYIHPSQRINETSLEYCQAQPLSSIGHVLVSTRIIQGLFMSCAFSGEVGMPAIVHFISKTDVAILHVTKDPLDLHCTEGNAHSLHTSRFCFAIIQTMATKIVRQCIQIFNPSKLSGHLIDPTLPNASML